MSPKPLPAGSTGSAGGMGAGRGIGDAADWAGIAGRVRCRYQITASVLLRTPMVRYRLCRYTRTVPSLYPSFFAIVRADAPGPPHAARADRIEPLAQDRGRRVHLQAHDVQRGIAPAYRNLHPRYESNAQPASRAGGLLQAFQRVVVRERDRVHAGTRGELDQLGGCEQTIRARRMVMQIKVFQTGKLRKARKSIAKLGV